MEDTVCQIEESNKKMEASQSKMEVWMKDMSEHFKLIQNHVSEMAASQNGHTTMLKTHQQSLHTLWCLVEDSQRLESTGVKYILPPSIPHPLMPTNMGMFLEVWHLDTHMTNSVMGQCIVSSMLEMMTSPALTTQTHLACAQSEESMEAGPLGTYHNSDTNRSSQ